MNKVTQSAIDSLLKQQNEKVVSVYLPTHRHPSPPNMQEDQTRFKNLIREAHDTWRQKYNNDNIADVVAQLLDKIDDLDFWRQATEGMAVFFNTKDVTIHHLPIECEERICVADVYDITPILALVAYDQPYYVLALAMHNSRLFRGDMYGIESVDIAFPKSPEDALNIDEMFNNSNTVRSPQTGSSGINDVISPHGQGDSSGAGREERLQYFRIIDDLLIHSSEIDTSLPILIAGTESEAGDFKALSKSHVILRSFIHGNYTAISPQEIHAAAWPIIRRELGDAETEQAIDHYQEGRGAHKSSQNIDDIFVAAEQGRVDTLMIDLIRSTRDSVSDSVITEVPKISFSKNYDQIAKLAHRVWKRGGRVLGIAKVRMPERQHVTAIYRY